MLNYTGDPQVYPPQHVALSPLSTSVAPFIGDEPHPADPGFPNPSLDVPAVPSVNAAGWGDASLMEAPARFMAPDAAAAASLGYTGEVFNSAPYGIYSEYNFSNVVDRHPLRSESSELISEKRPGICGESSEALSNGFGLSAHCQQQNAFASKLLDVIGAESVGCYYPRPVPNQDLSGSATSLISGAPTIPVKSLTSESRHGNISSQAAHTQILTKEGKGHSHCQPDAEVKGLQATLKGDDCLRNSSQMSCLRDNFSVAIPEHSVSENTDSEFNTYFSQALPKLPEDKMLDDSEVSQVSIYKKLWIEAEASVCKLKYELQVARMKFATKEGHNNTEAVRTDPIEGDKAFRSYVSGGNQHIHAKESSTCAATLQYHQGDSDGSQSPVVNRVSTRQSSCVLASSPVSPPPALVPQLYPVATGIPSGPQCDYCPNLGLTPQQCYKKSDLGHNNVSDSYQPDPCQSSFTKQELLTQHRHHNDVTHGPDAPSSCPAPPPPPASDILCPRSISATKKSIVNGVDAERLAPVEVLESRIDNVRSLCENKCEEQQEASKESHAVEDGVLAGLRILKSCTDNITSLSLESSKHQLDTNTNTTDEVDDAVGEMFARLKVLGSRIDTLSCLGENNYEEQQRESAGSYAVDDAVLARLRILKSRADNITSLGLESSKQQRDASTNTFGKIDIVGAEMCTRLEVLEPCIENLSSLGDNKCEEQQKDGVLARLQILKSRADNIISLGLESSKQKLIASTDIADEVDDAVMARLGILKSRPELEASLIGGNVEGVEDTCAVGMQVSSHQSPPSPAAVLKKTTLSSATEPLEVTEETPVTLIFPSIEVPSLSMLKDAPSVLEKDHSGLADDALPPAPLSQEVVGLARKIPKVKRLSHGPMPRSFRLPSTVKIKRPISKQGAQAILLRKLGMIKDDEVDEQAINRCLEILEASFPKSLLQAIFCATDMVKGTPGELWGISASDVVF